MMNETANELKDKLKDIYPCKLELHAHSAPASTCSEVPIEDGVRLYAEKGYSAIAFTNHLFINYVESHGGKDGYIDFIENEINTARTVAEKYGINVLWGAELRFVNENNNDYLLFGVDREILSSAIDSLEYDLETFVKRYKDPRSFLVQAHPFRNGQIRADVSLLDAVEVFNMHPNHNSRVALAEQYAKENHKIMTCGTDFHEYAHAGLSATRARRVPTDSFDLARLLRENDFIFQIGDSIVIE